MGEDGKKSLMDFASIKKGDFQVSNVFFSFFYVFF